MKRRKQRFYQAVAVLLFCLASCVLGGLLALLLHWLA